MNAAITDTKDRGRRAARRQEARSKLTLPQQRLPGKRRNLPDKLGNLAGKLPLRARLILAKLALLIALMHAAAVLRIRRYAKHARTLLRRVVTICRAAMRRIHGNKHWR